VFEREQYPEDLIEKILNYTQFLLRCMLYHGKYVNALERPLVYDPVNRIVVNDSEATAL
jgi:hypothetical protein